MRLESGLGASEGTQQQFQRCFELHNLGFPISFARVESVLQRENLSFVLRCWGCNCGLNPEKLVCHACDVRAQLYYFYVVLGEVLRYSVLNLDHFVFKKSSQISACICYQRHCRVVLLFDFVELLSKFMLHSVLSLFKLVLHVKFLSFELPRVFLDLRAHVVLSCLLRQAHFKKFALNKLDNLSLEHSNIFHVSFNLLLQVLSLVNH